MLMLTHQMPLATNKGWDAQFSKIAMAAAIQARPAI
jgi:hypothetical protein